MVIEMENSMDKSTEETNSELENRVRSRLSPTGEMEMKIFVRKDKRQKAEWKDLKIMQYT